MWILFAIHLPPTKINLWHPWVCNVPRRLKRLGRQKGEWSARTAVAGAGSRALTCRQQLWPALRPFPREGKLMVPKY